MPFKTPSDSRKIFQIIDTIRFVAMLSVVWGHCNLDIGSMHYHTKGEAVLQSLILQGGKFGTILFFFISGFLLEQKIQTYTPIGFLKLRLNTIIIPWIVFALFFGFLILIETPELQTVMIHRQLLRAVWLSSAIIKDSIFYFAYWFITVYFISALILIALKKYINQWWLGTVFALLTLFYWVNLYHGWVSTQHFKAFLGYILVMWIGLQMSRNFERGIAFLAHIPWIVMIICFIATYILACYEGNELIKIGCIDPYGSIRCSNMLNAFAALACLFKFGKISWINQLNPRKMVFGIYLLHQMIIFEITMFYQHHFSSFNNRVNAYTLLLIELVFYIFILCVSYLAVKKLSNYGNPDALKPIAASMI